MVDRTLGGATCGQSLRTPKWRQKRRHASLRPEIFSFLYNSVAYRTFDQLGTISMNFGFAEIYRRAAGEKASSLCELQSSPAGWRGAPAGDAAGCRKIGAVSLHFSSKVALTAPPKFGSVEPTFRQNVGRKYDKGEMHNISVRILAAWVRWEKAPLGLRISTSNILGFYLCVLVEWLQGNFVYDVGWHSVQNSWNYAPNTWNLDEIMACCGVQVLQAMNALCTYEDRHMSKYAVLLIVSAKMIHFCTTLKIILNSRLH